MKKLICLIAISCLMCLALPGWAEVEMDGVTAAGQAVTVFAPLGGTIEHLDVHTGDLLKAGDTIYTLRENAVKAPEDGRIAVFAAPGDAAAGVTGLYGAVAVLEPTQDLTISASTRYAYDREENRRVHAGERVYLQAVNDTKVTGKGTVGTVNGTEYTVIVTDGEFDLGAQVNVFRKSDYSGESRIGRGNAMRRAGQLLQADGVITSVYVKTGDEVKAGDRLFSWLSGERTEHADPVLTSSVDGVLAEIKVSQGQSVTQDAAVATLWPLENMVIEADLSEQDIDLVKLGDTVEVTFDALENRVFRGRVESIGRISTTTGQDATYTVRILPESTEGLRFGMHCTVKLP